MLEIDVTDKPHLIYYIDEKGCRLTLHHQQQVFARKGTKRVHIIAPEHAENVTIVSCGNAMGHFVPPMILFKGQRLKPEWQDNLPPGTKVVITPKGSMNCETFTQWIDHFAMYKSAGDRALLIFDGASSHLDVNIVSAADKHNITLFCLPSNTTHELQPLDKAVFKSFESFWDDEIQKFWMTHPDRKVSRSIFGTIFSKVWLRSMTPSNLISGFKATGIYPYNPDTIPEIAFAPSSLTNIEMTGDNVDPISSTVNPLPDASDRLESDDNLSILSLTSVAPQSAHLDSHVALAQGTSPDSVPASEIHDPTPNSSVHSNSSSRSLTTILSTPKRNVKKTQRRQPINSRAQKIVKSLFKDQTSATIPKTTRGKKAHKAQSTEERSHSATENLSLPSTSGIQQRKQHPSSESWYCFLCQEDRVADMRLCRGCNTYVHEECVGLTKSDRDVFCCPKCI